MTIDHHVIIIIFSHITILVMISCQLIETHRSEHEDLHSKDGRYDLT